MRISGRSQWVAVAGTVVLIAAIIIYVVASSGGSTSEASGSGSAQRVCEQLVDHSGKYEHGSQAWQDRVEECIKSLPPKD